MSRTGVDSVEVVEIGSETQSLDCSLDVFFDVGGRVGYLSFRPKDVKSTLGGHCGT